MLPILKYQETLLNWEYWKLLKCASKLVNLLYHYNGTLIKAILYLNSHTIKHYLFLHIIVRRLKLPGVSQIFSRSSDPQG